MERLLNMAQRNDFWLGGNDIYLSTLGEKYVSNRASPLPIHGRLPYGREPYTPIWTDIGAEGTYGWEDGEDFSYKGYACRKSIAYTDEDD